MMKEETIRTESNKTNNNVESDFRSFAFRAATIASPLIALAAGCSDQQTTRAPIFQDTATATFNIQNVEDFQMEEQCFTWGTDMNVTANGKSLGTVQEKNLSLTRTFEHYDSAGNLVAKARQKMMTFGTQIEITDAHDNLIGTIKKKVFETMFSVKSRYEVEDARGAIIAKSEKLDFFGTDIKIKDNHGSVVAMLLVHTST